MFSSSANLRVSVLACGVILVTSPITVTGCETYLCAFKPIIRGRELMFSNFQGFLTQMLSFPNFLVGKCVMVTRC